MALGSVTPEGVPGSVELAARPAHGGHVGPHQPLHDLQPGTDGEAEQPWRMSAAISPIATFICSGTASALVSNSVG